MRIHIATDHAGFELKNELVRHLSEAGHTVVDHGASHFDADDDYPVFCFDAAEAVAREAKQGSLGIVIGGSGNGEQIAANKVVGIRAALAWDVETATLARTHNNANVAALGARKESLEEAVAIVDAFVNTPFSGEERHLRRIQEITTYEEHRSAAGYGGRRGKSTWVD
jgi:ribose 5-phosphate isomerase B